MMRTAGHSRGRICSPEADTRAGRSELTDNTSSSECLNEEILHRCP